MSEFNAHREAVEIERDRLLDRLKAMEEDPTATLAEMRIVQREIEQLEHRLIWFDFAPKSWFR